MRLFVAIPLPEIIADAVAQLQSGLAAARWTDPAQFHMTLAFIGETDRRGLEDAHAALSECLTPAFDLSLSGCGFFGGERPRTLWVGTAKSEELSRLQAKVEAGLRRAGFDIERRRFAPHVTIARLGAISQDEAARFAASHNLFSVGPFPVGSFSLFESLSGGEGPHYEERAVYPLRPA